MAAPAPLPEPGERRLPDYLPARMVNEFVYCPRLFFYEWVQGVFRESADTIEGKAQHQRVDKKTTELPEASEPGFEQIHARSVMLSSDRHRVIAKIDLVEGGADGVIPVDYKHGRPRDTDAGPETWPTDRIQLAVQGLILRENGYACQEGVAFYWKTRQRVRVLFDEALMAETIAAIAAAWRTAAAGRIPPPLVDSPKCPGCSLVGICLPDETNALRGVRHGDPHTAQFVLFDDGDGLPKKPAARDTRPLVAARDDLRPLYLNRQGARVGKSGDVLQVRDKGASGSGRQGASRADKQGASRADKQDELLQEIRIGEVCQVNLMGNVQVSSQAIQSLCDNDVPICYFSYGGWFYGMTHGFNSKNIFLRRSQFRLAEEDWFALALARRLVAGKIRNQRTLLQRNHIEPDAESLLALKHMAESAERARGIDELLGIEGNAARVYFGDFSGMIKTGEPGQETAGAVSPSKETAGAVSPSKETAGAVSPSKETQDFPFDFTKRNRRPPRDPVNALLSLGYTLLVKDCTIACYAVGFDPFLGFYHQPRFGRPALALDLMEPFRPLIADSVVLGAINNRMITPKDFIRTGPAVALTAAGRKNFLHAYELRMDALVTHPLFDYRVSYRRLLEIQARLLARLLEGEIGEYPVFVTR